ncbi:type II toxin-antitoxin system RelE/ParE family toxin [Rhizobium sp. L1K21]|uniref:type II toxin-antitoxin system RelE/ParE family toxin n=1 Tax=Rhizobium sp. L1K21 TaxID=2954933 RepID=UPI00209398F0|nr:type II toxin-antitoxin system RelE/ParE family toxin [Rhizobium sp. L1K21]MCO6188298.1 type II toxin-antitoxin system RelE/ParE family toxin [Rhizobium sp. L1K21]
MKEIVWVKSARKEFEKFPAGAREVMQSALIVAAEGRKADIAKPMKGLGSGVMEIALPYRSDAYRVIYAVQFGDDLWVVHAFQKKSTRGIATPKKEVELIKARLKHIREMMP